MIRIARATRAALVLLVITAAATSCGREPPPVEELYATRMLGLGHLQRNELAEAETEFRKLTELAPDDAFGHAYLGLTWLQAARFPDAERELERARKLEPRSAEIGLMLSRLYSLTDRADDARKVLEQLRRDSTTDAHVLYALAQLDSAQRDPAAAARYADRLRDVLVVAPANLVARLELVDVLARRGEADSVVRHLEEVRRIPPELPREARVRLDSTIALLRAGKSAEARSTLDRFIALAEVTAAYQASLEEVRWSEGPIPGRLVLNFAPQDFVSVHGVRDRPAVDVVKFVDVTAEAGFVEKAPPPGSGGGASSPVAALAAGDVDGDGSDDLVVSAIADPRMLRVYNVQGGFVRDVTARTSLSLPGGATFATFVDYD
ncbi:MAG TPA: tetratricopeptide repeat protein, partial [Gemmatimonadaceae bacterium]|nr:tetratricopeptide repeat protein [Gemmatimonadaceae bacterium]